MLACCMSDVAWAIVSANVARLLCRLLSGVGMAWPLGVGPGGWPIRGGVGPIKPGAGNANCGGVAGSALGKLSLLKY